MDTLIENADGNINDWEAFVNATPGYQYAVRTEILDSWKRCSRFRLDPMDDRLHQSLSEDELQESLKAKERLIQVAHPFMMNMYKFVKGTGFVVVLANEEGYLLEMFADDDVWQNPVTKNFFLGASWREAVAGTNAIGTAVIDREAVQVSGCEHFCRKHHGLTCSAAPIFDEDGRMLGILDISGSYESSHVHTLGKVVAAAEAIMAQLRIQNKNHQLAVANKKLVNFFNMVSDGVLISGPDELVIEMNPAAEAIIGRSKQSVLGMSLSSLISYRSSALGKWMAIDRSYSDLEIVVNTNSGPCQCLASAEPFYDEQEKICGSFVTLRPIKQVQKLVNRFSGYMASLQFSDIIGESEEIRESVRMAILTAINNSNVLLTGESGTGKEIFAQAIHNKSSQCGAPFVPLNCGAIPRELIGSELFGYEEGAFTGAKRGGKPGKFEQASGGTLFLDEIGDMPLEHQTVLLRVIQEKRMARLGSDKMIPVNVRLICATNKNLLEEVERGTFRHDLFYRLNVMSIMIPPLRNRVEDIPLLFRHFLDKLCTDREKEIFVDQSVMDCLKHYPWPGNVRELQNVVERAANLAENGIITLEQMPTDIRFASIERPAYAEPLVARMPDNRVQRQRIAQESEKYRLMDLLNRHAGNISKVAQEMGVSRKTVYNKMKTFSIYN